MHPEEGEKENLTPNTCKTKWFIYARLGLEILMLDYFNKWPDFCFWYKYES